MKLSLPSDPRNLYRDISYAAHEPANVLILDLLGTFVFAISGAVDGVKHRLDVFGVSVLAFVAGNAGGMTRDLLIGAVPPAAITDWRYALASLIAGVATFYGTADCATHQIVLVSTRLDSPSSRYRRAKARTTAQSLVSAMLGMLTELGAACCATDRS